MEQEIFIYHSKERHPETGYRATVAARWNKKNKILYTGISLCSPEDQFVKRLGRHKAVGRTYSKYETGSKFEEEDNESKKKMIRDFITYYMKRVAEYVEEQGSTVSRPLLPNLMRDFVDFEKSPDKIITTYD